MATKLDTLPRAFIWRRLHSLTGLWFVIFLIEHLITNSQAALLLGESGQGFVRMVDLIHNLPYLTFIETAILGIPILIHVIWGIRYAVTAVPNSTPNDGSKPHMKYSRNHAYTWQRITSWILVPLLLIHIVKFRFLDYPDTINVGSGPTYLVKVSMDPGLYTLADRLDIKLYDGIALRQMAEQIQRENPLAAAANEIRQRGSDFYSEQDAVILEAAQNYEDRKVYIDALSAVRLKPGHVVAATSRFGTASLMSVRDTFKSPFWVGIYTVFVLCACFHAFNGLWTSMITWGWVIRSTAQTGARKMAYTLMIVIAFLGLLAVWGTYFFNLKY